MGGAPLRADQGAHRPLGPDGEGALGGFAIDENARRRGARIGRVRPVVRRFLADDQEQGHRDVAIAQPVRGEDHGGSDPLGVAGATPVQRVTVEAGRHVRWHRIEVRRQRHERIGG